MNTQFANFDGLDTFIHTTVERNGAVMQFADWNGLNTLNRIPAQPPRPTGRYRLNLWTLTPTVTEMMCDG